MSEFKIPELGENITSGDVVRVLVKPGDTISKDQPVVELETDKATIEVPSTVAGKVTEVAVKPGQKVNVGQVILKVEESAEKAESAEAPKAGTQRAEAPGAEASFAEAPRAAAPKKDAASAKTPAGRDEGPKPQPVGAPEEGGLSQDATRESAEPEEPRQPAEASESRETREPRETRKVVDISRGTRQPAAAAAAEAPVPSPGTPVPAAPSVRRVARELGIDIRQVQGSGPGGRISEEDVKAFVRTRSARTGAAAAAAPLPDLSKWGEVDRQPMSNIRRKTAEHLSAAWTAPHVTQHDQADITALEELRKKYSPRAEAAGGKLTITAIAVKVVAEAVRRFPQFNAVLDLDREEIVYRKYVNIGVAVDTERGLLVPVIRDADRKTITELSVELANAAKKARDRKLSLDEMAGGGMSITNLGGIGGTSFTPIVNAPEPAILGMSRAEMRPMWRPGAGNGEGHFEPRLMLPLSLSYDHRLIDGADAARFLRWVCDAFEQPLVLAL
jgi:pyruvate dehydrogenase E2 component (dihydrolipoamide acetyltransferase)